MLRCKKLGNGNLVSSTAAGTSLTTVGSNSSFYFEAITYPGATNKQYTSIGIGNAAVTSGAIAGFDGIGKLYLDGSPTGGDAVPGLEFNTGDLFGCAYSANSNALNIYKNGSFVYTISGFTSSGPYHGRIGQNPSGDHSTILNYGQQPFVASNATHDIEAGTVMLANSAPNYEKKWSNTYRGSGGESFDDERFSAFDGKINTSCNSSGQSGGNEQKLLCDGAFPNGSGPYTVEVLCYASRRRRTLCQ